MKCNEITKILEQLAPTHLALEWDNVGLLVGCGDSDIKAILLALDVNDDIIEEAVELGANLIITHHPIFLGGVKAITTATPVGKRAIKLIKSDIALYSAHTNLDICEMGTNDTLFSILELADSRTLLDDIGLGKVGDINKTTLAQLAGLVAAKLNVPTLRYIGEGDTQVSTVAICTGALDKAMIMAAKAKSCDVLISGDIKYHDAHMALDMGISLIDATHYATENIVLESVKKYLEQHIDIETHISSVDMQPFNMSSTKSNSRI